MFTVVDKRDGKIKKVYNIKTNKSGYPNFLIYEPTNNGWVYKSAKYFIPVLDKE